MVVPEAASQCWTKGASGIHRCTRQRSTYEDIYQHHQAYAKASNFWCTFVDSSAKNGHEQEERQDRFKQDTYARRDTRSKARRTELGGLPDGIWKKGLEQKSGQGCASELSYDIHYP